MRCKQRAFISHFLLPSAESDSHILLNLCITFIRNIHVKHSVSALWKQNQTLKIQSSKVRQASTCLSKAPFFQEVSCISCCYIYSNLLFCLSICAVRKMEYKMNIYFTCTVCAQWNSFIKLAWIQSNLCIKQTFLKTLLGIHKLFVNITFDMYSNHWRVGRVYTLIYNEHNSHVF